MDIADAANQRRSIRSFKPVPVPKEILEKLMKLALRAAPSWENIQPWEFAIVGGKKLDEIRQVVSDKQVINDKNNIIVNGEIPYPTGYPEVYKSRRRALATKLFGIMGFAIEDIEKRRWWHLQGLKMYGAPNVIFIYIDRSFYLQGNPINVWPLFDCGLIAQSIMLIAPQYGLGTVPQLQTTLYADVLKKLLKIPDSKLLAIGITIGYPNWDDPLNQFQSDRVPLEELARWYGID